jgi:hypothetical protein
MGDIMKKLIVLILLASSSLALAGPEDDAKKMLTKGNELLESGDYVGALDLYKSAYAKFPGAKILINIGTALHNLGRNAEAVDAYYQYLNDPGADPTKKAEIQKIIAELSAGLGTLRIEVNEPGTHLVIDGRDLGASPKTITIRVDPGTHMIAAQKQGFAQDSATVNITAGDEREVDLKLAPTGTGGAPITQPVTGPNAPPAAGAPAPPIVEQPPSNKQKIIGLSVGGVGVVGVGVGIALGMAAKSSYNSAVSAHCSGANMACDPVGLDQINSARSQGNVATVITIVGAAAIAGGVVLYLTAPKAHHETTTMLVPTGNGLAVVGGF